MKQDNNNLQTFLKDNRHLLITDIGSTTTKALLLEKDPVTGRFFFRDQCDAYTTVEKPFEDVRAGILTAVKKIQERSGISLVDAEDKFTIPYITTSSAGGGLQMIVFGLTKVATGKTAKQTAYGAGGVILQTFTIDDKFDDLEKMRTIRELYPDMILMAGGFDGGSEWGVMRQAQMLILSEPKPKFKQSEKIPLIYCGNENTRDLLQDMLEKPFDFHITPNIRPKIDKLNVKPTKDKIHQLFKENVMERAPGYSELVKMVSTDILPTPTGVEKTLKLYAEKIEKNMIIVDMGGATTDIYTYIHKKYHRTVAANIGLSYSISNILATIMERKEMERVRQHLPASYSEKDIRNYISNKSVYPQYLPLHSSESKIEQACTVEGFDIAWEQHIEMNFKPRELYFWEKTNLIEKLYRKFKQINGNHLNFVENVYNVGIEKEFQMSDIEVILGSGGVIAYASSIEEQIFMLNEGFKPSGITKLLIDKPFKVSHMGVLSTIDPELALKLFCDECVKELAYVIAPVGKIRKDKNALFIKDLNSQRNYLIRGGEFIYFKDGGNFEFKGGGKGIYLNQKKRIEILKTELPVLVDCRGREKNFIDVSIMKSNLTDFSTGDDGFTTKIPINKINIDNLKIEKLIYTRNLPYDGKVTVAVGDRVLAENVIGRNIFKPPKLYILDIRRFGGYDKAATKEDIAKGLMVKVGEKIAKGDPLFSSKPEITGTSHKKLDDSFTLSGDIKSSSGPKHLFLSPVRGKVTKISESGVIILEEIQDYDGQPIVVDIAKKMLVSPKKAIRMLKYKEGDFVRKDTIIAETFGFDIKLIKSPISGFIRKVDKKEGSITIQYDMKPLETKAYISGKVIKSDNANKVTIEGSGYRLKGVIGFGGENIGKLAIITTVSDLNEEHKDKIVLIQNSIDQSFLREAKRLGIKGIIAPSIDNDEWIKFYGKEVGVALTGDEDIPFSIILMMGFGKYTITDDTIDFFKTYQEHSISINGRTQIRAGITRPEIVISGLEI